MLQVGDEVPDFTLPAGSKDGRQEITLSKELLAAEVVLAFYPIAFSSTCTKQMCEIRDDLAHLRGLDARVLGFSTDAHHVNTAWARHEHLDFPLLADADRVVVERIWAVGPAGGYSAMARRGLMVIGRDRRVKYVHVEADVGRWSGLDAVKTVLAAGRL
ncbi:MAG TPA: redoxin domain-containing protein [Candidatus Thermoplasmatota archaeon]|nr:redoxin domain-containing protein [Candidatus Thermoplasmatota archaeon]